MPDKSLMRRALACRCPKCHEGRLFKRGFTLDIEEKCDVCGLDFSKADSADGPAVFLIFVLGFALVPLALILEVLAAPPLWVHGVLWSAVALGATVGALKPLKSYIIALQFKHRAGDFE